MRVNRERVHFDHQLGAPRPAVFETACPKRSRRIPAFCGQRWDPGSRLPIYPKVVHEDRDPAKPRFPCPTPTGRISYRGYMYMSVRTSAYCTHTSVPTKCSTWNIGRLSACRTFLACVHGLALFHERLHPGED